MKRMRGFQATRGPNGSFEPWMRFSRSCHQKWGMITPKPSCEGEGERQRKGGLVTSPPGRGVTLVYLYPRCGLD